MKDSSNYQWPLRIGATIALLSSPSPVQAISLGEIQAKAHQITVTIQSDRPTSGILIRKQGDRYTVLTTTQNVQAKTQIVTPDGQSHSIELITLQNLPNLDLAVMEFKSDRTYPIATLSITAPYPGQPLFLMGKAAAKPSFTPGSTIAQLQAIPFAKDPITKGYGLFYSNIAPTGSRGGPVLNSSGQVIAVHGRSEGEEISLDIPPSMQLNLGYSSGITIRHLIRQYPQLNLKPEIEINSGLLPEDVQAVEQILRPLREVPDSNSAIDWANHSNTLYRMGRLPEGIRALQQAIKLAPKAFALRYAEGIMFQTLGRSEDALKAFNQAIVLDPNQGRAFQGKAVVLAELGDLSGAIEAINQAVKLNPRNGMAWYWRGKFMNQAHQPSIAIESLNYATSLQPSFPAAWVEKSKAWETLGEPIASQAALAEAQKLDSEL